MLPVDLFSDALCTLVFIEVVTSECDTFRISCPVFSIFGMLDILFNELRLLSLLCVEFLLLPDKKLFGDGGMSEHRSRKKWQSKIVNYYFVNTGFLDSETQCRQPTADGR